MRSKTTAFLACALTLIGLAGPALAKMYRAPVSFIKSVGELATVELREMPRLDNGRLLAEAEERSSSQVAAPLEIAHAMEVSFDVESSGTWEVLDDGSRLWRLRISSPGALHLNLGFSRFDLPEGAGLWLYNPAGDYVEGPYTARHRSQRGRFYTPIVPGDRVVVELHVPADAEGRLDVHLGRIAHGFRGLTKGFSGSCNNDVVCPEGDGWRDQIRSVARYTINGSTLCTGQLVNNTAQDDVPYFLSAFHCRVTTANADTVVVYWNYESPICGQRGGGSLQQNQAGTVFRASEQNTDFLLLELNQVPDAEFNVFYTGWDVSGQTPQGSVGIHHPSGDVKAISFNDDPLGMATWIVPNTHWEVDDWEDGTTEQGSSGSCLWDPATRLCVGILTAGRASCTVIDLDIYGKLSMAWDVGGDSASRLRDWLDPLGLGSTSVQGKDPGSTGTCVPSDTVLCLRNRRFQVEVSRVGAGGAGPAHVVPVANDESGIFYFFTSDNWEMLLKVLDGCAITDHFWVFAASATDVEWTITVTDTAAGVVKKYFNMAGQASPAVTDTSAFATCP